MAGGPGKREELLLRVGPQPLTAANGALGETKPTLQIQIVLRQVRITLAIEQPHDPQRPIGVPERCCALRPHSWGARHGKPDPLAREFADDGEGLVALLRLQAVDGEYQFLDLAVVACEETGILVLNGEHGLIAVDINRDSVVGKVDILGIDEFVTDVRSGPMSTAAAVSDQGEEIPGDEPAMGVMTSSWGGLTVCA